MCIVPKEKKNLMEALIEKFSLNCLGRWRALYHHDYDQQHFLFNLKTVLKKMMVFKREND